MVALPVARAHERYILKLQPPEYPHLVANEHFFLGAAARSGIDGGPRPRSCATPTARPGCSSLASIEWPTAPRRGCWRSRTPARCSVGIRPTSTPYHCGSRRRPGRRSRARRSSPPATWSASSRSRTSSPTATRTPRTSRCCRLDGEWHVSPAYDVLDARIPTAITPWHCRLGDKVDESIGRADFVALGEQVGVRATRDRAHARRPRRSRRRLAPGSRRCCRSTSRAVQKLRRAIEYRRNRLARTVSPA